MFQKSRGGYLEVFTLRLLPFSAKLRPHDCMAEKKLGYFSTPNADLSAAESDICREYYQGKFNDR